MTSKRVALVTSKQYPLLSEDDRLVVGPLAKLGVEALPAVWDDPRVEWKSFDALVIRSPWDYVGRLSEFLGWVARMDLAGVRVFNSPAVLLWNASKVYLRELEASGVSIVPTHWMKARGTAEMLGELTSRLTQEDWASFVLKPAVSSGAKRTHRFERNQGGAELESALADFEPGSMVMLQPFLDEVITEGEWSLLFFGGQYSHAVLKRPAPTDYRVQVDLGGTLMGTEAPHEMIDWAEDLLRKAEALRGEGLLYARVDLIRSRGKYWLSELELLEPALYFAQEAGAAQRFASAIVSAI